MAPGVDSEALGKVLGYPPADIALHWQQWLQSVPLSSWLLPSSSPTSTILQPWRKPHVWVRQTEHILEVTEEVTPSCFTKRYNIPEKNNNSTVASSAHINTRTLVNLSFSYINSKPLIWHIPLPLNTKSLHHTMLQLLWSFSWAGANCANSLNVINNKKWVIKGGFPRYLEPVLWVFPWCCAHITSSIYISSRSFHTTINFNTSIRGHW